NFRYRPMAAIHDCASGCRVGWKSDIGAGLPHIALLITSSRQFFQQRLGFNQIGRVKALGEPAVYRREKVAGFGAATLVAAETGEAHGGAQFPELGLLLLSNAQGLAI